MNKLSYISTTISLLVHIPLMYGLDVSFLSSHGDLQKANERTEAVVYYITDEKIEKLTVDDQGKMPSHGYQAGRRDEADKLLESANTIAKKERKVRVVSPTKHEDRKQVFVPTVENINLEDKEVKKIFFAYYDLIRERLKQNTIYPMKAKLKGKEGLTYLSFVLLRDGSVSEIVVLNSSGELMLDQAAMNSIRNSSPFPPFPKNLVEKEIKLNVPISFELE